ncbi:hypothetical protein SERLA73DRAFT_171459 [Serpula lacrymans var. lacrymans S7.3]|uniref:Uncharacterized protein n=2 Tax=Serpula lacrymans var. lacrymans TaxID=341189 RepID=F8QB88_SERL3|nr:uncharacterized protein SERLADRAFT_453267 [Serpula lacrymans var. lacrymans S7.9]EGN94474.1 hypothetical protein SERLA73DRAFT_171459 [Serpula lacrymans var. lacrymans S7.3]EGO19953.1 hypothetical protein SERLADRAFT_453267 [Serpula lacrymans var. lacrymans S7.9]
MRGVSMPTHQYARAAESYLQPGVVEQGEGANMLPFPDIEVLTASTRAYTRIVLRIRAQAEAEAKYLARMAAAEASPNHRSSPHVKKNGHWQSRASSRAPSPTSSMSHSHNHAHAHSPARGSRSRANTSSSAAKAFHSPLYQLHRAPLLRVFVPSPDGDWLSDTSVMECEAELKRAGVSKLLRVGDVVWDVAAGDEGNVGRMVWDGRYLIDLEYKYSKAGDLPRYFHSLAFSPSYFHRVIRTGPSASSSGGNPIVYMDVSPWGDELAANLQLLQDRMRTETPQGALHNVVRWVHRTSFELRRPVRPHHSDTRSNRSNNYRLPIPNVEGFFVDPGWYGTIVIEAEGTNEGLADLQERCGPGVFPPRPETVSGKSRGAKQEDTKRVFRIMREKSRPGEIWIRTVRDKERLM